MERLCLSSSTSIPLGGGAERPLAPLVVCPSPQPLSSPPLFPLDSKKREVQGEKTCPTNRVPRATGHSHWTQEQRDAVGTIGRQAPLRPSSTPREARPLPNRRTPPLVIVLTPSDPEILTFSGVAEPDYSR